MSAIKSESFMDSPSFHEAMGHFRIGRWIEGFLKLADVEKNFPTEPGLKAIRQEMEVRSRISDYEVEENKHNRMLNLRKYGLRTVMTAAFLFIAFAAIYTYSGWIQGQLTKAQTSFSQNMQQAELTIELHNAQQLMIAGQT